MRRRVTGQSRLGSLTEALVNVCAGMLLAFWVQLAAFGLLGIEASMGQSMGLALIFTLVSLVRSYVLRRIFEAVTRGQRG